MCRTNVHIGSDNIATGHLAIKANNVKAAELVMKEQWATKVVNGVPCALVSQNLMTSSDRNKFVIHEITVPYKDPTLLWSQYFGKPAALRTALLSQAVRHTGPKVTFYNDQDDLRDALDDFLFG